MGYTGALYQQFFGSGAGIVFALVMQLVWMIVPLLFALKKFKKKDL
jgi:Cu-processing system permease protein